MPISAYDTTWANPAKTVQVYDADVWNRARKAKVWGGAAWILAWVHPVETASLSLSKTGVAANETYNVVLDVPGGFPEGASVTFRYTGFAQTVNPIEGALVATLTGVSHAASGTVAWTADVTTKGGNTSFGPVTQSVAVSTTSVTLTAPAWVLSTQSGVGGSATITSGSFTVAIGNPALVSKIVFQMSFAGGAWTDYKTWTSPVAASQVHVQAFSTPGAWKTRAVVTQTNAIVIYSAEKAVTCYKKSLTATASPASPIVGDTITLTATYTGDNLATTSGRWQYMRPADGIWHDNWQTGNPSLWKPAAADDVYFKRTESYSDGSVIHSNTVHSVVTAHYHEVVPSGASAASIQAAMDRAYNNFLAKQGAAVDFADESTFSCVELVANGSYNLGATELYSRRGVRLVGGGTGASRPLVTAKGTHFMKVDNNGGGGYASPHYDWMVHNLEIDCFNLAGGFSIVHTRRFQISSTYFHNLGPKKHYIEVNSSGNARSDGVYTVRIVSNEFTNSVNLTGRRVEDECIQLDYSWSGAASNTANDGTQTNNVLIDSNNFHDAPRAVGSHHFQTSGGAPDNFHANILVQNNTFTNIDPSQYNGGDAPNGSGSEGAVRAYGWEYVRILNNTFDSCFQPVCLYIPSDCPSGLGDPDYFQISGNYLRDVVQDRYGIYGTSAHATTKFRRVLIENNIADQTWDTSPDIYFAGCDDTRGGWASYSQAVIIRNNVFKPTNYDAAGEKAYNKYRAANSSNETGVLITGNTVSDGTEDNS